MPVSLLSLTPALLAQQQEKNNTPDRSFFLRLADAYREDWHPTQPSGPVPARRSYDGPLDSPPFPGCDYSVGGTPTIGAPDTQTYPLMQAINANRSRTKIYGWLNGGFNVSTSNKGDGANSPAAYYYSPNRVTADQQVLYIERLPNSVQTTTSTGDSASPSSTARTIATPPAKASFRSNCSPVTTRTATTPLCTTSTSTSHTSRKA